MKGFTNKRTVIRFEQSGINRTFEYNGEQSDAMAVLQSKVGKDVKVISGTCKTLAKDIKSGDYFFE